MTDIFERLKTTLADRYRSQLEHFRRRHLRAVTPDIRFVLDSDSKTAKGSWTPELA